MNATISIPMPTIAAVKAVSDTDLHVRITWKESLRPVDKEIVDLSPLINTFKIYRPLRNNPKLFRTARVVEDGDAIGWGKDEDLQISAAALERLAEETMTSKELTKFIAVNSMTHAEAAAALGYKRRQIENYLSGAVPVPRVVSLACYGFEARKQRARLGMPLSDGSYGSITIGEIRKLSQTKEKRTVMLNLQGGLSGTLHLVGQSSTLVE